MKQKKLQVFVSSTYADLIEERQAAVEAILSSGNIPAGMELFSAGDESQMAVIERWIDESDVYLLILGGRYGSIESKIGKSYTHLEYEYALQKGKPLFAVVISDNALDRKFQVLGRQAIEQENPSKLKEFRATVMNNLVKFWEDKKDIKIAIYDTLTFLHHRKDLSGWIRSDSRVNVNFLQEELIKTLKENSELRAEIDGIRSVSRFYSGLTYIELHEMLMGEEIDENVTLFDYLLQIAPALCGDGLIYEDDTEPVMERLRFFKVVERFYPGRYKFLPDGHNFYLKTLYLLRNNYKH